MESLTIGNSTTDHGLYSSNSDPLIPLVTGDKVVSAVLHANKIVVVTRYGRVYKIDPFDGTVKEFK